MLESFERIQNLQFIMNCLYLVLLSFGVISAVFFTVKKDVKHSIVVIVTTVFSGIFLGVAIFLTPTTFSMINHSQTTISILYSLGVLVVTIGMGSSWVDFYVQEDKQNLINENAQLKQEIAALSDKKTE